MYRSYSVNNMPEPIMHHTQRQEQQIHTPLPPEKKCEETSIDNRGKKSGGILDGLHNLQNDDIILLVVILILLLDDCDDKLLIAALGFIFLSDAF
jgi:hypothetical protein